MRGRPRVRSSRCLSLTPDTDTALPVPSGELPPLYLVPTETNAIGAVAQASLPVTFDFGYGDPDLAAISSGDSASGAFQGPATPGIWQIAPDPIGPFGSTVVNGTVSTDMVAHTLGFDPDVTSSTGDIEAEKVDPNAAAFTPLTLAPSQSGAMSMTITPSAKKGTRAGEPCSSTCSTIASTSAERLSPCPMSTR